MINKVEEIRISCECAGGSILEAIPNTTGFSSETISSKAEIFILTGSFDFSPWIHLNKEHIS